MFIRSSEESLKHHNSSFLAQDRVDNLMKAHSEGADHVGQEHGRRRNRGGDNCFAFFEI